MKWRRHRQRQRATNSARFRNGDRALDRGFRSGDHDLPRRINVRHRDHVALGRRIANRLHLFHRRPDQRRHSARADRHGFLHESSALMNDRRCFRRRQSADAHDRAVFAEGVAGDEVASGGAALFEHRVNRSRHRENCRLRVLRQLQLILGTIEAEVRDRVAERGVDVIEHAPRRRKRLGDIAPHAGVLAPLPGKNECSVVLHFGANDSRWTTRAATARMLRPCAAD